MTKEKVARINELARKKKTVGLTAAEMEEQAALRAEYLKDCCARQKRRRLRAVCDSERTDGRNYYAGR